MPEEKKPATDERRPWGDDFDEERAWSLIVNLRTDKAALQAKVAELDETVATTTKERDTAKADADAAKKERDSDRRASILKEFEIDEDDAAEFLPDGLSMDELRRKAERLTGRSKKKDDDAEKPDKGDADDDADKGDAGQEPEKPATPARPKPKLQPGQGGADEGAELDLDAIAARRRPSF